MPHAGLVLQHDHDVPPALLADWLGERGIAWRLVDVDRDGPPAVDRVPWVAVLGSRHSTTAREPAWIPAEIELLRAAIRDEVPVLGICFGGQALALALGADVHPAPVLEAGWDDAIEIIDEQIPPGPWLNFHRESFTQPPETRLLARSRAGPSAFRQGPHLGVQFHPEATPEIANVWGERYRREHLREVDLIALAAAGEANREGAARRAFRLFDAWWARL
jgi:GMP synthase-like glutamine amidotransferase